MKKSLISLSKDKELYTALLTMILYRREILLTEWYKYFTGIQHARACAENLSIKGSDRYGEDEASCVLLRLF
jgi:hypothetical protein